MALVVVYHANLLRVSGGYVGVDVFFVISGYLITRQLLNQADRNGTISLRGFYVRRMKRLLPAALSVIVVTLLVSRLLAPSLGIVSLGDDSAFASLDVLNIHLAAQGVDYLQAGAAPSALQNYWSLAVEEQFYLIWPAIILAVALVVKKARRTCLTALVGVVFAYSLYLSVTMTHTNPSQAYYLLQTRAWELALGAFIALQGDLFLRLPEKLAAAWTWLGLLMIVAAAFAYGDWTPYPGSAALLPVVGAGLVIAGGCRAPRWGSERILVEPVLQQLGKVSYEVYLWHYPMLVLVPEILGHKLTVSGRIETIALALGLSMATFVMVERPVRSLDLKRPRWIFAGLAASVAVCLLGLLIADTAPTIEGTGRATATAPIAKSPATVGRLLGISVGARDVPRNLTPSISSAANDLPASQAAHCHLNYLQTHNLPCVFGDPKGKRTLVLFGDSHIQQWLGALLPGALASHWKIVSWTKAACPAAEVTIFDPTLNRTYTECDQWRSRTLRAIGRMHPTLVLIGQSDTVPGGQVTNAQWAASTVSTLKHLQQDHIRAVLMADNPYPYGNVPACLSSHLTDVPACNYSRSAAFHIPGRHQMMIERVRQAGFEVIDPTNWFCTQTICPVIAGNMEVYRDVTHMTNTYSRWLANMVRPLFEAR